MTKVKRMIARGGLAAFGLMFAALPAMAADDPKVDTGTPPGCSPPPRSS